MVREIPIISEDDDTDIIGFQIEGHSSNAGPKLHHLTGLDLVESNNSGNTITDANHSSELLDIVLNLGIGTV